MNATSNTEVHLAQTSGSSRKRRDRRAVRVGDTVVIERRTLHGTVERVTYRLAAKTNLAADPKEVGPEIPAHKALLGKHPGDTIEIPRKATIVELVHPPRKTGH